MSEPSVSVIIPAYRAARTIGRALDSLLAQTRPPEEILVIDDGSPDDLPAVLASYGDRIRYFRQANGGASSARNRGIDLTSGSLIAFLDADDYWEPHKLERQLAILQQYPEVGFVAGHYYVESPGQPRMDNSLGGMRKYYDRVLRTRGSETLTIARRIWTSQVLVRRTVLADHRFDTTLATAEDADLWIRLLLASPVYLFSEPLATYVLEAGSLSRSEVAADCCNMLAVLDRYGKLLGRRELRLWKAKVYQRWAAGHLARGQSRQALRPAWRRLTHEPLSPQSWWIVLKSTVLAGQDWIRRLTPARVARAVCFSPLSPKGRGVGGEGGEPR